MAVNTGISRNEAIKILETLPGGVKVELVIRAGVNDLHIKKFDNESGEIKTEKKTINIPTQRKIYAMHKQYDVPLPNNGKTRDLTLAEAKEWMDKVEAGTLDEKTIPVDHEINFNKKKTGQGAIIDMTQNDIDRHHQVDQEGRVTYTERGYND